MLPVIPAAEDAKCSSTKVRKRKHKQDTGAGSHELGVIRRTSTIKTESTLIDTDDDYAVKEPERVVRHQRDLSLTVNWQQDDLNRMATELYDGIISDLELSLFAYWIKAKDENYIFAKELIRELALDQVCVSSHCIVGLAADRYRGTILTGFQMLVCASCCKKYMTFVLGPYSKETLCLNWPRQKAHVTIDERALIEF